MLIISGVSAFKYLLLILLFFPTVADREFLFKNMMGIKVKLFHFICSLNARTCKINFVYDVLWDHKIWHMGGFLH